jgi:hypothetical protein
MIRNKLKLVLENLIPFKIVNYDPESTYRYDQTAFCHD